MHAPHEAEAPSEDTIGRNALRRASERFVGRREELAQLRNALMSDGHEPAVFVVEGAPGTGKSTLASIAALHAASEGLSSTWLPCDQIDPTLPGLFEGLARLGRPRGLAGFGHGDRVELLVLDAFERIEELAEWLLTQELMQAGPRLVVLVTTRRPLAPRVACHLALEPYLRRLTLERFDAPLCRALLDAHGAEALGTDASLRATAGLPLALAVLAGRPERWREAGEPAQRSAPERAELEARDVREAFKHMHRPARLDRSPLLARYRGDPDPTARLLERLRSEVERLRCIGNLDVYGEVLHATYVEPRVKQQAAAIDLRLPWGTYRHRLRHAIELVTEQLRRVET